MTAVHCQEIFQSGDPSHIIDFPGDIIRLHQANGWRYTASIPCCGSEPLPVRNRMMLKSPASQDCVLRRFTKCSMANADVLLVFRRSWGKLTRSLLNTLMD